MCNLNIIKNADIMPFLLTASAISYDGNDDGDGIYCDKMEKEVKSDKKLNLNLYKDQLNTSNVILSHQRIATSGKTTENHQPLSNEEFVIIHNGVLWGLGDVHKSDTAY